MALMLCDHIWATLVSGNLWMTLIGRMAFPIFAFQVAEGFTKTKHYGKYLKRMFLFALLSEIPFNLMTSGTVFFPFYQNVLFTFCLSLILLKLLEWGEKKGIWVYLCTIAAAAALALILGTLCMVDYFYYGILTVLLFYIFRKGKFAWLGQLAGMFFINVILMNSMVLNWKFMGRTIQIPEQFFALFALIPIWLYNGKKGPDSKAFRICNYAFYPVHMLILSVIALYVIR